MVTTERDVAYMVEKYFAYQQARNKVFHNDGTVPKLVDMCVTSMDQLRAIASATKSEIRNREFEWQGCRFWCPKGAR